MPKYTAQGRIGLNGKNVEPGEIVELSAKEAAAITPGFLEPVEETKKEETKKEEKEKKN